MADVRDRDDSPDEEKRREAAHERGTLDPGLKEQFERGEMVVHDGPMTAPKADALQRPHYEPPEGTESSISSASAGATANTSTAR